MTNICIYMSVLPSLTLEAYCIQQQDLPVCSIIFAQRNLVVEILEWLY